MTTLAFPAPGILLQSGHTTTVQERSTESIIVGSSIAEWAPAPVVYSATSLVLNLGSMDVGKPYPVTFGGAELVAVKSKDGSVRFYAIPE